MRWALIPALVLPAAYVLVGKDTVGAVAAVALVDPLSIFSARSPGARSPGALAQSKPRYLTKAASRRHLPAGGPTERVLANTRTRLPVPDDVPLAFQVPQDISAFPLALPPEAVAAPGAGAPFGGSLPFGPGALAIVPASTAPVIATPPDVAAVPEPLTWGMMLAGFLGIGTVLRRHRAIAIRGAQA